MLIELIQQI
ncbi:hypothetical protein [Plasmodium yoelii yoelii]|uniref:Uncharacterized protein n=1 Tax=Plasmodium yoelii yoelii TaxID=73239 RepID=Q7RCI3_PLAYO|nr:hypothetical protein [Plasmodium yoelii yoelii]